MQQMLILSKTYIHQACDCKIAHTFVIDCSEQLKAFPLLSSVHFMAHYTNMVVQTFSGLTLVAKTETLLVGMYNFFTQRLKRALEASKLIELLECKGNKILKNIT